MPLLREHPWYSPINSIRVTTTCFILIAITAFINAFIVPDPSLGYLYLVPLAVAAAFLSRWQIVILALICTAFWDGLSRLPYTPWWLLRDSIVLFGFVLICLLFRNLVIYSRAAAARTTELQRECELMASAATESELLINSAPVAVVMTSHEGVIIGGNRGAHELLSVGVAGLVGQHIRAYLPDFDEIRAGAGELSYAELMARRADGEHFSALIWSSNGSGAIGDFTTMVIVDSSKIPLKAR